MLPPISYHAHLRRLKRIRYAVSEYHCAFNLQQISYEQLCDACATERRLERLAKRQYHESRAHGVPLN